MERFPLSRYVLGFLLSALVVSGSVFVLSLVTKDEVKSPEKRAEELATTTASVPEKAFVESIASLERTKERKVVPIFENATTTNDNLTSYVLEQYAQKVERANLLGPQTVNGVPQIDAPDVDAILADIAAGKIPQNIAIPNWELQAAAEITKTQISSSTDHKTYQELMGKILESQYTESQLPELLGSAPSLDAVPGASGIVNTALNKAEQVSVPTALVPLHQSLVRMFVYERNALGLREVAYEDPIKAIVIQQAHEDTYTNAVENLSEQIQQAVAMGYIAPDFGNKIADQTLFAKALGIKTANAQWIVHDPAKFFRDIWEWVQKLLLSVLKDQIIHKLVQQTVSYIQGGGKPQFITNFKEFVSGAANVAAGQAIEEIAPGLCRGFGPLIRLQLEQQNLSTPPAVTCTLDQVVANVENFYDDFSQGGWIGFGAMSLPSGNYFGQLFEGSQVVALRELAEKESKQSEAAQSGGFKNTEVCVEYDIVNEYKECIATITEEHGNPFDCIKFKDEDKKICSKYETTTPGQAAGQALYNALGSPIHSIVSAEDIRALVSALVNSALNKLVGLVNGKPNRGGILAIKPSTIGTPVGSSDDGACKGKAGDALVSCLKVAACGNLSAKEKTDCLKNWSGVSCTNTRIEGNVSGTVGLDGTIGSTETGGGEANLGGPLNAGITFPGKTCTAVFTNASSTTTDDCSEENCNGGSAGLCNCKCRDNLTEADFCFYGDLLAAQDEVEAEWLANPSLDVGLVGKGICPNDICVQDGDKYAAAVIAKIKAKGLNAAPSGDEVQISGSGSCNLVATGKAGSIGVPRAENFKIVSSLHTIQKRFKAVCPAP